MEGYFVVKLQSSQDQLQFRALAESVNARMTRRLTDGLTMFIIEGEAVLLDAFEQDIRRLLGSENYLRYNRPLPNFPLNHGNVYEVTSSTWQAFYG